MRQKCALDRRTILCLYIPGFQRQVFEHVPKYKWIVLTNFQWIPRTNTCNITFVGTLILLRIPQQTIIGSRSVFGNCKRIPPTICGIHLQLGIPRQLKFTKHI